LPSFASSWYLNSAFVSLCAGLGEKKRESIVEGEGEGLGLNAFRRFKFIQFPLPHPSALHTIDIDTK